MSEIPPNEVYAVFASVIDQNSVARIFAGVTGAMGTGRTKIHLLFQSAGGSVADGVALYNFFRGLTIPLALYNVGACSSIAAIAYLGAAERKVSAHAMFMLHRTTGTAQAADAATLHAIANSVVSDDERTERILRERVRFSDAQWKQLDTSNLWITPAEAVKSGLATSIQEFVPPIGTQIFNV
jgi:ATP-dependent protease ClpP protease subunit